MKTKNQTNSSTLKGNIQFSGEGLAESLLKQEKTLIESNIYRFSIKPPHTVQEIISKGVDSSFADNIGETGHMFFIAQIDDRDIIFFSLSSRFFHFMFNEEIGSIKKFYENDCNDDHKNLFKRNYKKLFKLIEKYSEKSNNIYQYDDIFLMNKGHYGFEVETFMKIHNFHSISYKNFQQYKDSGLIDIHPKKVIRDIDKKAIAHKIQLNINEQKAQGKESIQNNNLEKIANHLNN